MKKHNIDAFTTSKSHDSRLHNLRRPLFGSALVLLLFTPFIGWAEVNVLQNGSFERRTINGIPAAWTRAYASPGGSSSRASNLVQCGEYSCKLYDASTTKAEGVRSDAIEIVAGVSHTVEGFVYRTATSNQASLYLKYYDAAMVEVASFSVSGSGALNQWTYVSKSGRAPANAAYAKVLCYSTTASSGTMYFDGVSLRRSEFQRVNNPDMSLDSLGAGYPLHWEMWAGSSQPVSVAQDPMDQLNKVMMLEDISSSQSANAMTRIPVIANLTYTASADILYASGNNSASIYLKYYDEFGTQLASASVGSSAGTWTRKSVTLKAPEGAVEARVLAYIAGASTGVAYFDDFDFVPNWITRYVAPAAVGLGDGSSAANAAKFNNAAFWSGVDGSLASQSVKVIFVQGDYVIDDPSQDVLLLKNIGEDNHVLIMEGERPFASVFTRTASATNQYWLRMVTLQYAKNVVVRHLHWENDTPAGVLTGYSLVINANMSGSAESRNIIVEGCSFVGLDQNYYGAMGFHHPSTHNVEVSNCEFVRVGYDGHCHMIYNSWDVHDIQIYRNYFQDCSGAYVKHRAGCRDGLVTGNTFVSTATAFNQHFVIQAVHNDTLPALELLGNRFVYSNNTFTYAVSGGINIALQFRSDGYDPTDENGNVIWEYLLTAADRDVLLNGTLSAKKTLMRQHYDLDFGTDPSINNTIITGNVRQGYHAYKIRLSTFAQYGAQSKGGDGHYNISDLGDD